MLTAGDDSPRPQPDSRFPWQLRHPGSEPALERPHVGMPAGAEELCRGVAAHTVCADEEIALLRFHGERPLEQAGERQMTVRRDETASQLRAVATGGRVRAAYESQR